jgi:hypothetical protein
LQKLGFSGVERPFEIIASLRGRGISGERLSEYTRDNAFELGTENVLALAAEHRKTNATAQGIASQRTQISSKTIAGALKDSSPVLNSKPIDLSKEEDPFPITESDNQVLGSCPDSPLDADQFSLYNKSTDSAKFKSAVEAASRGVVVNPCSPLKNILSFTDKKKAKSRRVSSTKSARSPGKLELLPVSSKPSALTSPTAVKPASTKSLKKASQHGSPSTGLTSRVANLERGVLKLRRAVGVTSDDNTEGTSVPQRIGALEAQVDNLIVAVNNNTKATAALKIRASALFQKLN